MTDSNVEVTQYQPPVHDNHGLECYVNRQEQIIAEAPFSAANHMEDLGYMVCTEKEFELLDADPCMSTSTQGLTSEDTFALTVVDCENESGCQAQPVGLRVIAVDPPSDNGLPPLPDRLERIQNSWGYITIKAAEHNGYGGAYAPGEEVYFPSTADEYRGGGELLPPEGEVIFVIEFDDENGQGFFDDLRESTDLSDRQTLIETRRAEVTDQHLEFLSLLSEEVTVVGHFWLDHSVAISAPTSLVDEIIDHTQVVAVHPAWSSSSENHNHLSFDMNDVRRLARTLLYEKQNYYGESGGRITTPSDNIKIAIIEGDDGHNIDVRHVGWDDWSGGPSRVISPNFCTPDSCVTDWLTQGPSQFVVPHNLRVASIIAGSIQQGQDVNYPGNDTVEQRRRSGLVREAEVYSYLSHKGSGVSSGTALSYKRGFEKAVADGVDVMNMSAGFRNNLCESTYNPGGLASTIWSVKRAGIPLIVSTGNMGELGNCTVNFPAALPFVTAVGALDTDEDTAYISTPIQTSSSYGRIPGTNRYGHHVTVPGVSIAAPSNLSPIMGWGSDRYTRIGGTSAAAPVVSATTALALNWMRKNGLRSAANEPTLLQAIIGVFGDGASHPSGTRHNTALSSWYGFGRLKTQMPAKNSNPDPLNYNGTIPNHRFIVSAGEVGAGRVIEYDMATGCGGWLFPCDDSIDDYIGLKATLIMETRNVSYMPVVSFSVIDKCDNDRVIASASSNDYVKKQIIIDDPAQIVGTCPAVQIRVQSYLINPVKFASAAYMFKEYDRDPKDPWDYH